MFSTYDIKTQWKQVFCCGNPDSKEVILILGSCRVVPYLNYLHHYNQTHGNRFKIYAIDPINMQVDMAGNTLPTTQLLKDLETDKHFLGILKSVTIFIHEGLSSFGILNTVRESDGLRDVNVNIYNFGMAPEVDVNIPNFHDVFILFNDFNMPEVPEQATFNAGCGHIARFCNTCRASSFPEFADWFMANYLKTRLFHSHNHVSSAFTREIFRLANEKFLHLDLDEAFWQHPDVQHDMYANVSTKLTELDRKWRAYEWE